MSELACDRRNDTTQISSNSSTSHNRNQSELKPCQPLTFFCDLMKKNVVSISTSQ